MDANTPKGKTPGVGAVPTRAGQGSGVTPAHTALGFREWKTLVMAKLAELSKKHPEHRVVLEGLMLKLQYVKARDLAQFLLLLHLASREVPELADLIPKEADVKRWIGGGKE